MKRFLAIDTTKGNDLLTVSVNGELMLNTPSFDAAFYYCVGYCDARHLGCFDTISISDTAFEFMKDAKSDCLSVVVAIREAQKKEQAND